MGDDEVAREVLRVLRESPSPLKAKDIERKITARPEMATSRKGEEYKLTIINTMKTLRRPCTTLDLARSLKVKRTEINPYLYDLQKQGLIKKIQESNPPKWDLTGAGNMYGVRKGTLGQNPAASGHGILSFVSSSPLPHLVALNAQQSDDPVEKAIEGHSHIPISGIHSSASISFQGETHSNGQSMSPVTKSHSDLQLRIIQALEKASKPLTALEVANCVGLKTRKEANPDLYVLQKENVVSMDKSTGPPLWTLLRDKLAEVEGSSVCQGGGGVEKMELQSYSSSGVDLSQIPQDDLSQRLLVVMQADPGLKRTELELRNATETKASRMEVKTILESLLKEGKVQKTWTTPTKWWIPNPEGSKNALYLNPNAPPFPPTGSFPLGATGFQQPSSSGFQQHSPSDFQQPSLSGIQQLSSSSVQQHSPSGAQQHSPSGGSVSTPPAQPDGADLYTKREFESGEISFIPVRNRQPSTNQTRPQGSCITCSPIEETSNEGMVSGRTGSGRTGRGRSHSSEDTGLCDNMADLSMATGLQATGNTGLNDLDANLSTSRQKHFPTKTPKKSEEVLACALNNSKPPSYSAPSNTKPKKKAITLAANFASLPHPQSIVSTVSTAERILQILREGGEVETRNLARSLNLEGGSNELLELLKKLKGEGEIKNVEKGEKMYWSSNA